MMARFIKVAPKLKTAFIFCGIGFIFCGAARAQNEKSPQVPIDKSLDKSLAALPNSPLLPPLRWFASTDPKHQNEDYIVLKAGETRRIPLTAGHIERLWSTALFPDQLDLKLESGPVIKQVLLANGKAVRGSFTAKTYTYFPDKKPDYYPGTRVDLGLSLDSGAALVATNRAAQPSKWFYQVAVRPKNSISTKNESKLAKSGEVARRTFRLQLAPGEEKIAANFDKPGQIQELVFDAKIGGAKNFRDLKLKISFDGQKAIDAPLLSLAGQIEGEGNFRNAVADFRGSRLILKWPMPFEKAQISLENRGGAPLGVEVSARIQAFDEAPSPFRFCATQFEKTPMEGKPVEILNLKGAGALVGLATSFVPDADSRRRAFAYLEGNELITADGKLFEGTGTEDFFTSAWYFPDAPFFRPYEGMSQKIKLPPSVAAYRFLIPDAIPFKKSLKFDFEHGNRNNAEDIRWKMTAFWYQKLPVALPVSDAPANVQSTKNEENSVSDNSAPVAPGDRWKIAVAVGAGVLLGIAMRLSKRRRKS